MTVTWWNSLAAVVIISASSPSQLFEDPNLTPRTLFSRASLRPAWVSERHRQGWGIHLYPQIVRPASEVVKEDAIAIFWDRDSVIDLLRFLHDFRTLTRLPLILYVIDRKAVSRMSRNCRSGHPLAVVSDCGLSRDLTWKFWRLWTEKWLQWMSMRCSIFEIKSIGGFSAFVFPNIYWERR